MAVSAFSAYSDYQVASSGAAAIHRGLRHAERNLDALVGRLCRRVGLLEARTSEQGQVALGLEFAPVLQLLA